MNDTYLLPATDRRPSARFWLLVAGALLVAVLVLVGLNYAGAERRTEEARIEAQAMPTLHPADVARLERRGCVQYTVTDLAPVW